MATVNSNESQGFKNQDMTILLLNFFAFFFNSLV